MRVDEFSRNELGEEIRATIQEFTSQVQKLQERMDYINDSQEFQDIESIRSGKLSHVPRQPAVVPSPRAMSSRDQSLRPDTWNLSGTQGNVFGNPCEVIDSLQTPYQIIGIKVLQVRTPCETVQGNLSNAEICRETINHEFVQQKGHTQRITWLINKDFRSRSFNLTNSRHLQRFRVGRYDSKSD